MKIGSLIARGAVITALAASGAGLTSVAAQAGCNAQYYVQQRNYYQSRAANDYDLYSFSWAIGDTQGATFYLSEYQLDLSTVEYYTSRINMCNARQP